MAAAWETTDIALAAWISLKGEEHGIRLSKVMRNGKAFGLFVFRVPETNGHGPSLDDIIAAFPGSEAHRFDAIMRSLKAMGHSKDK